MHKRKEIIRLAFGAIFGVLLSVPASADVIGDAAKGARVFKKCAACHQVGPDAKDRVGPHLNDVFGREAGSQDGFRYSKGLVHAGTEGLVWDLEHLDAYLENPKSLVTGTRMNFRGLSEPEDRANVLAFLRQYSDDPANYPEAEPTAIAPEVELAPEVLAIVGDREYGEYLASECTVCHQIDGSDQGIPSILNWPTEDFVIVMHAYKAQIRSHPVMQMMAGRLSNEEIAALAVYFEGLE